MEKKNLIFALILSIVVITVFNLFFVKKKPITQTPQNKQSVLVNEPQPVSTEKKEKSALESIGTQKPLPPDESKPQVKEDIRGENKREYIINTELYTAVFTNKGAALESFVLKKYKDDAKPEKNQLDLVSHDVKITGLYPFHFYDDQNLELFKRINLALFKSQDNNQIYLEDHEKKEISFIFSDPENKIYVKKTYTFYGDSYVLDFNYEIVEANQPIKASYIFGPKIGNNLRGLGRGDQFNYEIGSFNGQDTKFEKLSKFLKNINQQTIAPTPENRFKFSPLQPIQYHRFSHWVAYSQNYFTALFKTDYAESEAKVFFISEYVDQKNSNIYTYLTIKHPVSIYLGPKDASILKETAKKHKFIEPSEVISLGWFGFISKLLREGIIYIHNIIPNYGWAIVLLTIFLRIILFPLTLTSSKSMAKMQTLQPKIKAIKKKFKNYKRDPEQRKQMNVETMALYKKEKVNPASGCFPMLLQMPILFGFFTLLRTTIEVRHEPWILWIQDLSLKDPLYILPISMGITQIIVQKLSPTSADANQKKMAYIMPVFFVFICLSLPSGLTLYWFISNLLMIFQQKITNNLILKKKKEEERGNKQLKKKRGS